VGLYLYATAGLGPAAVDALPDPLYPAELVISPSVQSKLLTLAHGLHSEIVLCLDGTVEGDTARVSDLFMPEPRRSTHAGSEAQLCPEGAIAVWHNHPLVRLVPPIGDAAPHRRAMRDPNLSPRALCALSTEDLETADHYRLPFMVVAVDRDTWCWWSLADVSEFRSRGHTHGPALPGQRSWDSP
jgi:hypothetical protein